MADYTGLVYFLHSCSSQWKMMYMILNLTSLLAIHIQVFEQKSFETYSKCHVTCMVHQSKTKNYMVNKKML